MFRAEGLPTIQSGRIHGEATETSCCARIMSHGAGTRWAGHEFAERTVNPRRPETSAATFPYVATNEGRSATERPGCTTRGCYPGIGKQSRHRSGIFRDLSSGKLYARQRNITW